MNPEPDVVLTIPLCPKCVAVKRHVSEISKERPELTVKWLNMLTNMGLALRHGFLTAPTMLVRGKLLKGVASKQTNIDKLSDEKRLTRKHTHSSPLFLYTQCINPRKTMKLLNIIIKHHVYIV